MELWKPKNRIFEECPKKIQRTLAEEWYHGRLQYKFDPLQKLLYRQVVDFFASCSNSYERLFVTEWARRLGKDFFWVVFTRMQMRKYKKRIYYYGTAFETDLEEILIPIIDDVQADCPPPLRLKESRTKGHYTDPDTRSVLRFFGIDKNPDGVRGKRGDGFVITEYSYCNNIDITETALKPMLVENRRAWRSYNSTPGESVGHKWHTEIVPKAKRTKGYSKRTLDECPRFEPDQIDAAYEEFGGRETTKSRREYRCEHIGEASQMIIGEWVDAKDECVVDSYVRPPYAHCYVSLDPGVVHLCGLLFGYYHFEKDMLVVEHAWAQQNANTSTVADEIARAEKNLWHDTSFQYATDGIVRDNPYKRISDTDRRMILDLATEHDLDFDATAKDNLQAAVNGLRIRVQNRKLRVLPGAQELVTQLDAGIWNKQKTKFECLSGELGHFDLIAALIYMHRNLDTHLNPRPQEIYHESVVFHDFHKQREQDSGWTVNRDRKGRVVA